MARLLQCAVEQLTDWHPILFVEPHEIALVAIANQYSEPPADFLQEIDSRRVGLNNGFRLRVFWHNDTAVQAERMRATIQTAPIVELAAVALGFIFAKRVVSLGTLRVTNYGDRADYRSRRRKAVLEMSGTQKPNQLERRHREKVTQALDNPFG